MALCKCECGQEVTAGKTWRHGHNKRTHTIQDLLLRLVICEPTTLPTGCWEWPGGLIRGYGQSGQTSPRGLVHRVVYEHFRGPVPEGLELDHLCRNRKCANFEHLEPVTHSVNLMRGIRKTKINRCPLGHPYDKLNTYVTPRGGRECRTCRADDSARRHSAKMNAKL